MPKAGEKLSDEQKEKMAEGRAKARAEAQSGAVTIKEVSDEEAREVAATRNEGLSGPAPRTEAEGDAVEEWGPYSDNRNVETEFGFFGVPFKKVLFFRPVEKFNVKAGGMVTTMQPFYRKATPEELVGPMATRAKKKRQKMGVA